MVAAAGLGVGIGHAAWPQTVVGTAAAAGPTVTSSNGVSGGGPVGPGSSGNSGSAGGSGGSASPGIPGSPGTPGQSTDPGAPGGTIPGSPGGTDPGSPSGPGGSAGVPFGQQPFSPAEPNQPNQSNRPNQPYQQGGAGQTPTTSNASGGPSNVTAIAAKVDPALVDVNVTFAYQGVRGAGTGIVLTPTGEILTNNHVIDGATSISVTDIGNGKTYQGTVTGYDSTADIAVLQLHGATGLKTATIGDSSKLAVGQPVVGIGNAGGLGGTPSVAGGSVTALDKGITVGDELYGTHSTLSGLIEVNADIQSGDSGGSLVNTAGAVIGVDTAASAGFTMSTGGGDGYAVPINTAMTLVRQIESGKGTAAVHVGQTAALGVLVASSAGSGGTGSFNGNGSGNGSQNDQPASGAQVAGVVTGGAAAGAGLVAGDVITSLGGHAVDSSAALTKLMAGQRPGTKVTLGWTDTAGQAHTASVTLGTGPAA